MRRHAGLLLLVVFIAGLWNAVSTRAESRPRELWVTAQGTGRIYIRRLQDGAALGEIRLPERAQPHIVTFSSGAFAYVSDMATGRLFIIDADHREVVRTLQIAPTLTHQARVSPDGTIALVAVVGERKLVKISVDEANRTWGVISTLSFFPVGRAPICTIFRGDGQRAYVSILPSGIAIIDPRTMTHQAVLETDGFIACGMIRSRDGVHAWIASSGGGGHIYTLDMRTDTLTDRGTLGAADWHSFITTADDRLGFGTSPASDEVIVADLSTTPVTKRGTIRLAAVPTLGANQPDALGGGDPIVDGVLPVSLRAAGQVALIDIESLQVKTYVPLAAPAQFNPGTCAGCAVHGVTVRP